MLLTNKESSSLLWGVAEEIPPIFLCNGAYKYNFMMTSLKLLFGEKASISTCSFHTSHVFPHLLLALFGQLKNKLDYPCKRCHALNRTSAWIYDCQRSWNVWSECLRPQKSFPFSAYLFCLIKEKPSGDCPPVSLTVLIPAVGLLPSLQPKHFTSLGFVQILSNSFPELKQ